jgi:hypothetical protein
MRAFFSFPSERRTSERADAGAGSLSGFFVLWAQAFIEHYTGCALQHTGLGTAAGFALVSHGKSREVVKGLSALQRIDSPEARCPPPLLAPLGSF